MRLKHSGLFLALLLGMALTGCSSFHRDWRRAAHQPAAGIYGRWDGTWRSAVNGHHGKLRCLLTPDANGHAEARFRATYLRLLSFNYTVTLQIHETNETSHLTGTEDLGAAAGGQYDYQGVITATNFSVIYRAAADHGTFELKRP